MKSVWRGRRTPHFRKPSISSQPEHTRKERAVWLFWASGSGTSHTDQYYLMIRFLDGTLAKLPLPFSNPVNIAPPDTMNFSDGRFTYEIRFEAEDSYGQTLYHLAGTYRYTVDLEAKTVSLSVTSS